MEKLKEDAKKLDSEAYYGLLACIITGRSWQAINDGINIVKYSSSEVCVDSVKLFIKINGIEIICEFPT
jgi:hypothetical protein